MGHTFINHLYHIIFSTKGRAPLIRSDARDELHQYICGIARKQNAQIIRLNSTVDHLHLLAAIKPTIAVADFVRVLKANSSKWFSEHCGARPKFEWQAGYSSFTVSESKAAVVKRYIDGQKAHHRVRTFAEELRALLEAHGIAYEAAHYLD